MPLVLVFSKAISSTLLNKALRNFMPTANIMAPRAIISNLKEIKRYR